MIRFFQFRLSLVTLGIGPDGLPRLCGSCQRVTKAISF